MYISPYVLFNEIQFPTSSVLCNQKSDHLSSPSSTSSLQIARPVNNNSFSRPIPPTKNVVQSPAPPFLSATETTPMTDNFISISPSHQVDMSTSMENKTLDHHFPSSRDSHESDKESPQIPISISNNHSMVTRAKSGIYKPKVYNIQAQSLSN